ncbi:MAG: sugar phosphate isomerase/epimerase family protein [Verrucomicrobiales bacterium]
MPQPPVALQLWSLREQVKSNFAETIKKVAELGYQGVELAGYGNFNAEEAARALQSASLQVAGMHVGVSRLENDMDQLISEAKLFNTKNIVLASPGRDFSTVEDCDSFADKLSQYGATLRKAGLKLAYHNHAQEFRSIEGQSVLDRLYQATAPRDLKAQPDVWWVLKGGVNPAAYLRALGGRISTVHLKDGKMDESGPAELGQGDLPIQEVLTVTAELPNVEWLIVEQEDYNYPPLESVKVCLENLKKLL